MVPPFAYPILYNKSMGLERDSCLVLESSATLMLRCLREDITDTWAGGENLLLSGKRLHEACRPT